MVQKMNSILRVIFSLFLIILGVLSVYYAFGEPIPYIDSPQETTAFVSDSLVIPCEETTTAAIVDNGVKTYYVYSFSKTAYMATVENNMYLFTSPVNVQASYFTVNGTKHVLAEKIVFQSPITKITIDGLTFTNKSINIPMGVSNAFFAIIGVFFIYGALFVLVDPYP
jgi:hypothetical protein